MGINSINGSRCIDANGAYGEQATYEYRGALSQGGFDLERYYITIKTGFSTFRKGLRFTTMAGYFFPGDDNEAGNAASEYGDAWAWNNQLQIYFQGLSVA